MARLLILLVLPLALAGCGSNPPRFAAEGLGTAVTPVEAARDDAVLGQRVLWGGVIVNSQNLADVSQLEVLAYPLNDRQRPNTDKAPLGRFLAIKPGYLETADFAPGRLITISGKIQETAAGRVGEARYTYPVVHIDDSQLWQREASEAGVRPRVSFGVGIMIGR